MIVLCTHPLADLTKQVLLKEGITHAGPEQSRSNCSAPRTAAEAFTLLSFKEGVAG